MVWSYGGVGKGRGFVGKFPRERNQSPVKDHLVQRKSFWKQKKFFRREKTLLTLGKNFSGCDKPSPLKRNLVPRFGDLWRLPELYEIFFYGLIYPYIWKTFCKTLFYKILKFSTKSDQHSAGYFLKPNIIQAWYLYHTPCILRMAWQGLTKSINIGCATIVKNTKVFSSTKHKHVKSDQIYTWIIKRAWNHGYSVSSNTST